MGVAKSLRKAGHLSQLGQGINNLEAILEENRKKKEREQLYNNVVGLVNKYQEGLKSATNQDVALKEGGKVKNVLSSETFSGQRLGGGKPTGMGLDVNLPENTQQVQQNMAPVPPETQTRQISPQEKFKNAETIYSDFENAIIPILTNPNVGEEDISRLNIFRTIAEKQKEKFRPKERKIGTFNPEYDVVDETTGEVLRKGTQKQKPFDVEGSMKNPKTKTYWSYNKQTGEYFDTQVPYDQSEGKSSTTNNYGSGDYNYSNLYSNVQEGIKVIKSLKSAPTEVNKETGMITYYEPGNKEGKVFANQKEFDTYKEGIKNQYVNDAYELVIQRGLDNAAGGTSTPVKKIREGLSKGFTLDGALKKFKENNPEFPEEDLNIMKDYFTLSKL